MRLHDWARALRTVQYLRPAQALHQVRRRIVGPARNPKETLSAGIDDVELACRVVSPSAEGTVGANGGVFLVGRPAYDALGDGWRASSMTQAREDPLWAYTLHYHGWLTGLSDDDAEATMLSWIGEHHNGVGWEPYPSSIRLLHWLGWLHCRGGSRQAGPRERVLQSMAAQLRHLANNLEEHIDGNHLWTNLAALTACGLALRGPLPDALADRFSDRFAHVVATQLFGDGVHRERTPSYHCLLAEQLAIVAGIAAHARPDLHTRLRPALLSMVSATAAFTHPDGDVALFGDSQLQAPVTPTTLAATTALTLPVGNALAAQAGLARRVWGPWTVLWNVGGVGIPWQTGHIHGDGLAVELSLQRERVIVDAGVGTYARGDARRYARSTAAHNTATVGYGEPDQHELWASHRIARRARPQLLAAEPDRLEGEIAGVSSPAAHRRIVTSHGSDVLFEDRVQPHAPASVRWFLPATAAVQVQGGTATVRTAEGQRFAIVTNAPILTCTRADGWHGMSRPAPRLCLAATVGPDGLVTRFAAG